MRSMLGAEWWRCTTRKKTRKAETEMDGLRKGRPGRDRAKGGRSTGSGNQEEETATL